MLRVTCAGALLSVSLLFAACSDDSDNGSPATGGSAGTAAVGGSGGTGGSANGAAGMSGSAGSTDGGDAGACGPNVPLKATGACAACTETKCCAQKAACGALADCVDVRKCGGKPGCGSGACWEQCVEDHPVGAATNAVFAACMAIQCESDCGFTGYGKCGLDLNPSATCKTCLEAQCCTEIYDTSQSADFWLYSGCTAKCGSDSTCKEGCKAAHSEGAGEWDAVVSCNKSKCTTECGWSVDAGSDAAADAALDAPLD